MMSRVVVVMAMLTGGSAASLVGVGGCVNVVARSTATTSAEAAFEQAGPLTVTTENGYITVRRALGETVTVVGHVVAQTQARADATTLVLTRGEGGSLGVTVSWPEGGRQRSEGCSIEVLIPAATTMTLVTSNGALTVTGMSGEATLRTSNGAITVADFDGRVSATTSNGAIVLQNIPGATANTSNGRITVALADGASGPVSLRTSNGAIELSVGSGFDATVTASTSNGRVSVVGKDITTVASGKNSGTYKFGEGTQASTAKTSNGSVTITRR